MCDSYKYFKGRCNICGKDTNVRNKNIWLIGSEGTDMCWSCEKEMINFLEERKRFFLRLKIKERKKMRKEGKTYEFN
jgi:hypothetical protein